MRRLLHFLRRHRPITVALYRLLLLMPILSGEMVLSMLSIAGLTLSTLPPFNPGRRKPEPPQLDQWGEEKIVGESFLSHSIRNELEKAARIHNQQITPPVGAEEIIEAEWDEETIPQSVADLPEMEEEQTPPATDSRPLPNYPHFNLELLSPPSLPDYPGVDIDLLTINKTEEETPATLPQYPCFDKALLQPESTPSSLPQYPSIDLDLLADEVTQSPPPLPHYPVAEQALLQPTEERSPPLPIYPRIKLDLLSTGEEKEEEEEAFEEEESSLIEEPEEDHTWLPTRERADALFALCQLYSRIEDTEIPLSILIGDSSEDELFQLSSESLDGAMNLKQEIDELSTVFDFNSPQQLFDHLLYCSISPDRSERIKALLTNITPMVMESMMIVDPQQREQRYQQIFDHLFEAGEFLHSEQPQLFEKWHEEFIPPSPPEENKRGGEYSPTTPEEEFSAPSESAHDRISAALENLQKLQQQELDLQTPEQQERASVEMEREKLKRKRRISRLGTLSEQQGLPLKRLIDDEVQSKEENEHLLNLLLSARSDHGEEYIHFSGHLRGTPADLLIESLLRIKLQNRTCTLFQALHHLDTFDTIQQRIFDTLSEEFSPAVVQNHRSSIEQHIEWASSSDRPHCNNNILPQRSEL